MTAEEFASLLNGRQYREEITRAEEAQAKESGLVVIFGASDDCMEIRGCINDELACFDGNEFRLGALGVLEPWERCDTKTQQDAREWFRVEASASTVIRAVFADVGEWTWTYETALPHATFEVLEGADKYCRGIVFAFRDSLCGVAT